MTVHGTLATLAGAVVAAAVTWALVPVAADPRRVLGYAAGVAVLAIGITWMVHV